MPGERLTVTTTVSIPYDEIEIRFSTSGGPGGQHANKTSTRVELRYDVANSRALRGRQRAAVIERVGPVVRIVADSERSQLRNRAVAYQRLARRLAAALRVEPTRVPTHPGRGARERRLDGKRQRSELKHTRRRPHDCS